jgi:phosphatidylglycerophosphatase C
MNVYDFDKTIYAKDSSIDFYLFNLRQDWTILRYAPKQVWALFNYKLKRIPKTRMKQVFYTYFKTIKNMDERVKLFWDTHEGNVRPFYATQRQPDDVIISASPTFLLAPLMQRWGVNLIATEVDPTSGLSGENCWGPEKVKRFKAHYPHSPIDQFYSDHLSDVHLAKLAKEAFLVSDHGIVPWPFEE